MNRAIQISVESDSNLARTEKQHPPAFYFLCFVFCILLSLFFLVGCSEPEPELPVWEQVKIGDLTPAGDGKSQKAEMLKMTRLDVHIFEIPAENITEIDKIRSMDSCKAFNDYCFDTKIHRSKGSMLSGWTLSVIIST